MRMGKCKKAGGREVVKGSGVYKMVDPTLPPRSCSVPAAAASRAAAQRSGGIAADVAVAEATRQRLKSMRNRADVHSYTLSDPL